MSQTILIEPNKDLKKIYALNLSSHANIEVIERSNAKEAIELIQILPNIDLIICADKVHEEKTAYTIYQYLQASQYNIPLIVLGEEQKLHNKVLQLKREISWELLTQHACETLGLAPEATANKNNFIPISINFFYSMNSTPCDLYIRIQKTSERFQFVKRLKASDSFNKQEIQRYAEQGLKNFYITKDYQQYFTTHLINSIIQSSQKNKTLGQQVLSNSNSYEIIRSYVQALAIRPEILELTDVCLNSMIESVKTVPQLSSLLQILLSDKISFAYQKSHLACVIGHTIISKQSWYEQRHLNTFTKLCFFSDITLKSTRQLKINSQEELDYSGLTLAEKEEVLTHAQKAAEVVALFPNATEYLKTIVLQHQGSHDGHGFLKTDIEILHPLVKVFIIADAFTRIILDPELPNNKKEILPLLYNRFDHPNFIKIIKILEQKLN